MSVHHSRYIESTRIIRAPATSTTDLVKRAATDELERQRGAIDTLRGVRIVTIRVALPPIAAVPALTARSVRINLEMER